MTDSKRLLSFAPLAAMFAGLIWSWSAGAPRPPRAFEPPSGVLPLSGGDAGDPALSSGINDTFYFGGTRWAPDSSRWEAIPDSVWTFESGVGSHYQHPPGSCKDPGFHAQMEGWVGADPGSESAARFRRLGTSAFSGTPCVGAAGGLSGDYSFWAGLLEAEADSLCWASGQGYGNNWSICIVKEIAYDGAGCLHLDYRYHVDVEPGWDYVFVMVDTTGTLPTTARVDVASYTGPASGTESLTLTAGADLPSQAGPILVKFCVLSDGAYSDEDGDYATSCGAFGVDDIRLWNTDCGGAIDDLSTFETGTNGWVTDEPCLNGRGLSRLVPVSELPWPPGYTGGCDLGDSVLAFYDPATGGHPLYQDDYAVSPWIDLKDADKVGFPKKLLELGGYFELPLLNYVFVTVMAQWYPDTCSVTGRVRTSPPVTDGFVRYFDGIPTCAADSPRRIDFTSLVPPTAEQVRVGVGVVNYCQWYAGCTGAANSTPWFDNIRFGVATGNTIQSLVDAAAPGDTVLVGAGTFTGAGNRDITFRGKEVVLLAPDGPDLTVIDCQGAARGFIIDSGEDSTLVIEGFTVRNGKAPATAEYPYIDDGGAVLVSGEAHPTFKNCRLESSLARYGGGVYVGRYCDIRLEGCTLEADSATSTVGAAVYGQYYPSTLELVNSTIRGNRKGAAILWAGVAEVDSCSFEGNNGSGMVLYYHGGVRDCTFSGNARNGLEVGQASQWGCGSAVILQRCIFSGNQVYGVSGCGGTIEDCTFSGNGAGGVVLDEGVTRNCQIQGNLGVGVYMRGGLLQGCTVSRNHYGGVYAGSYASFFDWHPPTIVDCVIVDNEGSGVTFPSLGSPGHMTGCTVSGNHATVGGGVRVEPNLLIDIRHSIIEGNCADSLGADVYTWGDSTTVTFHCCAIDSSGFAGSGQVIYDGPQVFTDPLFCSPASCFATPTTAGDYHLTAGSPCLPESSPCDSLIGALGLGCSTTGVPDDRPPLPLAASLRAYPNPFRADVTFVVGVPADATGTVEIFDVRGRRVREFEARAGETALRWDGHSEQGAQLPQGIYFFRLRAGVEIKTQRVILIR